MKILIIRFSSIGDIILTTPVIRCIKRQIKDVELHYLTKKSFANLLESNPYIDKRFYLGDSPTETITRLQSEQYDYVIDLHKNIRSQWVGMNLNAERFSFNKLNIEKWLMVNFKINLLPDVHIVDRYLKSVKPIGVENDGEGLDYFIPPEDEVRIEDLPLTHIHGFIGIAIGAKHFTKRLPLEKLAELCENIKAPIILLGGKEDEVIGDEIKNRVGIKVFNGCGKFNLNQSASIVKQAKAIVTHDTSLMHIAAAFKKKIYSVWGNTIPEFGMYPYYGDRIKYGELYSQLSHIAEIKNLYCRPCSKIGYDKCPKKHFRCMLEQDMKALAVSIYRPDNETADSFPKNS